MEKEQQSIAILFLLNVKKKNYSSTILSYISFSLLVYMVGKKLRVATYMHGCPTLGTFLKYLIRMNDCLGKLNARKNDRKSYE